MLRQQACMYNNSQRSKTSLKSNSISRAKSHLAPEHTTNLNLHLQQSRNSEIRTKPHNHTKYLGLMGKSR